jgi:UDP-GlcNAc:undecaprenyl-phosphate/decaprenyl-phosphate GlcNAc-1-phosphate transferase
LIWLCRKWDLNGGQLLCMFDAKVDDSERMAVSDKTKTSFDYLCAIDSHRGVLMFSLILTFISAFTFTYLSTPYVIKVANERRLFDPPNERSSHTHKASNLGGISIFGGAIFAIVMWTPYQLFGTQQYILAALLLLFLVGIWDDMTGMPARPKFVMQVVAALIIVYKAQYMIDDFGGFLWVNQLPKPMAVLFSVIVIVGIINAYNFIDGINGLAAGTGILASLAFGGWFYLQQEIAAATIAFALCASLLAFMTYNFIPGLIFMGDTGSMFLGTVLSVLAIHFIRLNLGGDLHYSAIVYPDSAHAIAVAFLILPIYDTLRVSVFRMAKSKSPFSADRNHIHHMLLDLGFSHVMSTLILLSVMAVVILLTFVFIDLGSPKLMMLQLAIMLVFSTMLRMQKVAKSKTMQG